MRPGHRPAWGHASIARRLGYASDRTARGMARRFAERLGAEPSIEYFESPVIVDNDAGAISIAA